MSTFVVLFFKGFYYTDTMNPTPVAGKLREA